MKTIFTLMTLLFTTFSSLAEVYTLVEFTVFKSMRNKKLTTAHSLEINQMLFFMTSDDNDDIVLANCFMKPGSCSVGNLRDIKYTDDGFTCLWDYANSYDEVTGTGIVTVVDYEQNGEKYATFKIITEVGDVLEYWCKANYVGKEDEANEKDAETEKFRKDYNKVCLYMMKDKEWGEWHDANNTFVFNINENTDISHYFPDGRVEILRNVGNTEEGETDEGYEYQITTVLDEEGNHFRLQLFDDPGIGLKLIGSDYIIQFANFN